MSTDRTQTARTRRRTDGRPARAFALGWQVGDLMIVIVVCAFLFLIVGKIGFGAVGLLAILTIPALVVAAIVSSFQKLGVRREAFLSTLASAVRRGVPLPRAIEVLADLGGLGSSFRLRSLARRLDEGIPLPAALRIVGGLVTRDTLTLIQTGQETGRLAEAIELAAQTRAASAPKRAFLIGRILYFLNMILLIQFIIYMSLGGSYVVLMEIVEDQKAALPAFSSQIIRWSDLASRPFVFTNTILADLAVIALGAFFFATADRLPLIRLLSRAKHSALVMRTFSFFIEVDRPATEAFDALLQTLPPGWVFNAVARAAERSNNGEDWIECLRDVRLIRSVDASALAAARRAGNLGWALGELARRAERRHLDRVGRRLQLLHAFGVITLGAIVLLVVVGYFAPLVIVIEKLSHY